ncbi:glycosyltransferase family 1 protein [Paenibacillus sambharensis]|uniref:Glycosyltransferase family 1 protein n=1 Tax=Paenibacillus sambharensis TaxID=1803190 RepID=A0A2W1LSB6_9BACL|nr:glycosyltransferase family 4 protein [Paenibacillus sambharensis]PZD94731.1 glycosyltransferase family 1 protein [Paenibacillus sambharensis]
MNGKKRTLLFLSWRDIKAPKSGGAEVFTHEMLKRLDTDRYEIIHYSPMFPGANPDERIDGVRYIRKGGNLSVIFHAQRYYAKHQSRIDYVVDQCNTHRFFTPLWVKASKRIFFIHQLTREIWHLNAKFPVSTLGYWTETPMLRLSRHDYTMTVSNSTRKDLLAAGFNPDKMTVLPEGIEFEHWPREQFLEKEASPVFIYVGRFVHYKGIDDTVKAFSEVKRKHPQAKLWVVGKTDHRYVQEVLKPIMDEAGLSYGEENEGRDVTFFGFVSASRKLELMSRSHALLFPSLREGWGLIITEAGAVGTPSIVYHSPGIIDAVDEGRAGFLCSENKVEDLAGFMNQVIEQPEQAELMREKAYKFSLNFHWRHTAASFDRWMDQLYAKEGGAR